MLGKEKRKKERKVKIEEENMCFTPIQPVQLYQGKRRNKRKRKERERNKTKQKLSHNVWIMQYSGVTMILSSSLCCSQGCWTCGSCGGYRHQAGEHGWIQQLVVSRETQHRTAASVHAAWRLQEKNWRPTCKGTACFPLSFPFLC